MKIMNSDPTYNTNQLNEGIERTEKVIPIIFKHRNTFPQFAKRDRSKLRGRIRELRELRREREVRDAPLQPMRCYENAIVFPDAMLGFANDGVGTARSGHGDVGSDRA